MADPYTVLGVTRDATDEQVRTAYRRLVKLTHPDHNGGSKEAAQRFEAVQEAYAEIQRLRRLGAAAGASPPRARRPGSTAAGPSPRRQGSAAPPPPPRTWAPDPEVEDRLADLERQVREARQARDRAEKAAREAAARATAAAADGPDADRRPTDEELGYVTTDDSFWKILRDARSELADRYAEARKHPADHPLAKRVSDLIEGLEALTDKLDRKPPGKS